MTHLTTRYYQDEANDAVAWGSRKNNLLVMATGCGKTFTAAQYVAQYTFGKVLWIATAPNSSTRPRRPSPTPRG